jgi:hypothetical protein
MRFPYNERPKSPSQQTWTNANASTTETNPKHTLFSHNPTNKENSRRHLPGSSTGKDHQHSRRVPQHPSQADKLMHNWSWLSSQSPLMSSKSEAEWILDRLSAALERELDRQRKGRRRHPPISLRDARKRSSADEKLSVE